jgi:hypothetical protein
MVEMLMAAFVLAIGLLGLTTLQVMSLRTSTGSQNRHTAVRIADQVMDQIELEGRLGWLNQTASDYTPGTLTYQFIGKGKTLYFAFDNGGLPQSTAPVDVKPTGNFVATISETAQAAAVTGGSSDFTVLVEFKDQIGQAGTIISRSVTLTRRILHG